MTSRTTISSLAALGLFRGCRRKQLACLLANTDVVAVRPGTVLAKSGTAVTQFLAIIEGTVEVRDGSGRPLALGPGDYIGREIAVGRTHIATCTAVTRVVLVVIYGPAFRWAMREIPTVTEALGMGRTRPRRRRKGAMMAVPAIDEDDACPTMPLTPTSASSGACSVR